MAQFDGISKAGRDEKLSLLVGVLAEFKPLGIASIMPHTIFQQYFGYLSHPEVRNPYIPSVFSLIGRVTEHQYLKGVREPIEFIFDYQPGSNQMAKIQEAWEMFKGVAPPAARCLISAHPPQFLDDRQVRPLQAADFHVGVLRYVHEAMLNGRPVLEFSWNRSGSELRWIQHLWDEPFADSIYEQMFGHRPVKFSYSFKDGIKV